MTEISKEAWEWAYELASHNENPIHGFATYIQQVNNTINVVMQYPQRPDVAFVIKKHLDQFILPPPQSDKFERAWDEAQKAYYNASPLNDRKIAAIAKLREILGE